MKKIPVWGFLRQETGDMRYEIGDMKKIPVWGFFYLSRICALHFFSTADITAF